MEKIDIKLKECCLTCEHISPDGLFGGSLHPNREISCQHMAVCYKYAEQTLINVIHCGECMRWMSEGCYSFDPDGTKRYFGVCDITETACKETHFCSYGRIKT